MTTKNKAAAPATNELAPTQPNLPAVLHDFGQDYGDGLQGITTKEVGVPFIKILQAQSPEVIGPDGKIPGATAGMLLNTGTSELATQILFVPAVRQHVFVEWKPRKQGGGLVAIHQLDSDIVKVAQAASKNFGEYKTEGGNELAETFYVFGVTLDPTTLEPTGMAVIPFTSTGIQKYKKGFMNRIMYCLVDTTNGKRNPPLYAHRIRISTTQQSNDDGTWFNYDIAFAVENNVQQSLMEPNNPAYQAAKALKLSVDAGEAKADQSRAERGDRGASDGGSAF